MFENTYVKELSSRDFDVRTGTLVVPECQSGTTIVMIYSPYCGHCHHTKPDLVWLSDLLDPKIYRCTAINAVSHSSLLPILESQWNIQIPGFPTLIKFKGNEFQSVFEGNRTRSQLFEFMMT